MSGTVTNALSPEEKPIIENMISLLQQLLGMQEGANTVEEPPAEAVAEMAEEQDEMDTAQAVDVGKSTDGETGDSKAEERLEEQTGTTDHSMADLKKALVGLQSLVGEKTKQIQKSATGNNNSLILAELKKLNKDLQYVLKNQKAQETLNQQLFDAIGFSDDVVQKSLPAEKKDNNKPVQNVDTTKVVKEIVAEVFKNIPGVNQNQEYQHPFNQKKTARKNLQKIAEFIHNKR